MTPELRALLESWLASGSETQRAHARYRLAQLDAGSSAYPPLMTQAANAASAVGRVVKAVVKQEPVQVSDEEQARRLAICHTCDLYDPAQDRCRKCGCRVNWKARLATEHCPINLW